MKAIFALLCLISASNAFAAGRYSVSAGSSAQIEQGSKFSSRICIEDNVTGKPLANSGGDIGLVHASAADGKAVYQFELSETEVDRTYIFGTDETGCFSLADTVIFGNYDGVPKETYRGRVFAETDAIAERVYGVRLKGTSSLLLIHLQFNKGIKKGRVFSEVVD